MSVHDEILQLAKALCDGQENRLAQICCAVEQNLQAQLRSGISVDDCHDSFVYAAALMSLSIVKTVDNDQLSGFDAGTLKLNFADRTDHLSTVAKQLLAPWCGADDFAFRGVRS